MKRKILLIFTCVIGICSLYSQDNPTTDVILKATKSVLTFKYDQNELDYVLVEDEPIKFIHGTFTGMKRNECIVICPMRRQHRIAGNHQNFVMLFHKTATGTWTKGRFAVLEQEIDTIDINNDSYPELICSNSVFGMGESYDKTTIYQIKNDVESILYSNTSEDHLNSLYIEVGGIGTKMYEIHFFDEDDDGIFELEENLAIGIVESFSDNGPEIYYKKEKRILKLVNGKYQ
jgi:hypothetical protein